MKSTRNTKNSLALSNAQDNLNNFFLLLPAEILLKILNFVHLSDIHALLLTSSLLNNIAQEQSLWFKLYDLHFPSDKKILRPACNDLNSETIPPEEEEKTERSLDEIEQDEASESEASLDLNSEDEETASTDSDIGLENVENYETYLQYVTKKDVLPLVDNEATVVAEEDANVISNWYEKFRDQYQVYAHAFTKNNSLYTLRLKTNSNAYYTKYFTWVKENALDQLTFHDHTGRILSAKFTTADLNVVDMYGMTLVDWAARYHYRTLLDLMYKTLKDYSGCKKSIINAAIITHQSYEDILVLMHDAFTLESWILSESHFALRFVDIALRRGETETAIKIVMLAIKNRVYLKPNVVTDVLHKIFKYERYDVASAVFPLIAEHNQHALAQNIIVSLISVIEFLVPVIKATHVPSLLAEMIALLPEGAQLTRPDVIEVLTKTPLSTLQTMHAHDPALIHDETLLSWAMSADRVDILNYCRDAGVADSTLFRVAILSSYYRAQEYLSPGFNLHQNVDGRSLLCVAIQGNHMQLITQMIELDPTILDGEAGIDALFELIGANHWQVGQQLLMIRLFHEVNPNLINDNRQGMTAFMVACQMHALGIAQLLREFGANSRQTHNNDNTFAKDALYYAITSQRAAYKLVEILNLLADEGVDLTQRYDDSTILHCLATLPNHLPNHDASLDVVDKIVTDYPDMLEAEDKFGNTPLATALVNQRFSLLADHLLKLGANPHVEVCITPTQAKSHVLFMYAMKGNSPMVRKLIDTGLNVKSLLALHPSLSKNNVYHYNVKQARTIIQQEKKNNKLDVVTYKQRQKVKAFQNTAKILKAIEAGDFNQHLSHVRRYYKKPSTECARLVIENFQVSIKNSQEQHFFISTLTKKEKKTLDAFPKLEKAHRRLLK